MRIPRIPLLALGLLVASSSSSVRAADPPLVEKYLHAGKLVEGDKALLERLAVEPKDDQARFGLGMLRFARAVERLAQSFHAYGLKFNQSRNLDVPFLRLPVPRNPNPRPISYDDSRKILIDFLADLDKAETTLKGIQDDSVKLPIRLGPARLDLDGDGKPEDPLLTLVNRYMRGGRAEPTGGEILIVFDRGDVAWLRGYCRLLSAMAEIALAHDGRELFESVAHVFFAKPMTRHMFLLENEKGRRWFDLGDDTNVLDLIAMIHLVRLPVKEPERMKSALGHLEAMLALSRETWKYYGGESDNDHEWIPNSKQTGVLGVPVRAEMMESWLEFITETEDLLAGRRLAPFWRGSDLERGINLKRVFTEPTTLDLVLWLQGTAATPYLEKGPLTRRDVWNRLGRVFGGEFIGFAFWFN